MHYQNATTMFPDQLCPFPISNFARMCFHYNFRTHLSNTTWNMVKSL